MGGKNREKIIERYRESGDAEGGDREWGRRKREGGGGDVERGQLGETEGVREGERGREEGYGWDATSESVKKSGGWRETRRERQSTLGLLLTIN